jgi:uncharacterized protein YoaH (UPF0181 family)
MKTNIPDSQLSWHEKRFINEIITRRSKVNSAFSSFSRESSKFIEKYSRKRSKGSIWRGNRKIEAQIDKLLINLQSDILRTINEGQAECISLSKSKFDNILERYIKGMSLSSIAKKGIFEGNIPALKAFLKDKSKGLDLSGSVWKVTKEAKEQIELFLESGVSTGRSAAELSRDLRSNLKDPDKRFRRIKDPVTGKYKLSKPMANFHPGTGRYRSAYKNALRLTGTAINRSYRLADNARWDQKKFVLGYSVELSNNHPTYDICDSMVGTYPKTFVFAGWHPNCICFATPILPDPTDFAAHLKGDTSLRPRFVKKMPPIAQDYFDKHIKQYETWKEVPWWVSDNFEKRGGIWRKRASF